MLNVEKFKKEIIDIGLNGFACTKDNKIKRCADIYSDSIFKRMEINKQYSLEDLGLC